VCSTWASRPCHHTIAAIDWLIFILILMACGGLLAAIVVWAMARVMLRPVRMTDARAVWLLKRLSPGDLSLPFAPMSFRVRDEDTGRVLNLAAWWIPAGNEDGRCAVLIHGYADAKVGAIAWAPLLHSLGYGILAIDLPGHGESDWRPISFGFWERHLIGQVIDQVRAERANETRTVVLYGLSYGALVAVATAGIREDIAAVVLDSPPISPEHAERVHCDLAGLPGWPFSWMAMWLAKRMAHTELGEMGLMALIERMSCPLLVIECGEDLFMPEEDRRVLAGMLEKRRGAGRRTEYLFISESRHLMGMQTYPEEYARAVGKMLLSLAPQ
jgi:uncharacterized protein